MTNYHHASPSAQDYAVDLVNNPNTELATGGASVQAFAVGPHTGLQFHPEATEPITADWLRATRPPLSPEHAARLSQGWAEAAGRVRREAATLFSAWLDGGLAGPATAAWNTQRLRG